jgi:hypothetical protein
VLLPSEAWEGEGSLGEAVAAVWPGATADITFDADPLGATLVRFADSLGDIRVGEEKRPALASLQGRPGRQHRAMYRWGAAAIALAACVMGVAAFVVNRSATAARDKALEVRSAWRGEAGRILPAVNEGTSASPNLDYQAVEALRAELERQRKAIAPVQATPEKPVLPELETLSFVLSNDQYQLQRLSISGLMVVIEVIVPGTAAYEELSESLNRIAGSAVSSWDRETRPDARGVRATFTGRWSAATRSGAPGGIS